MRIAILLKKVASLALDQQSLHWTNNAVHSVHQAQQDLFATGAPAGSFARLQRGCRLSGSGLRRRGRSHSGILSTVLLHGGSQRRPGGPRAPGGPQGAPGPPGVLPMGRRLLANANG